MLRCRRLASATIAMIVPAIWAWNLPGQSVQPTKPAPWAVLALNAKAEMHLPPVCQPLAYFSSSPRRFDYGSDMWGWPKGSYTYTADQSLIGTVDGHDIYQVDMTVRSKTVQAEKDFMKLLLVGRSSGDYCLIFDEQDGGQFFAINQARLEEIGGEQVLRSDDPVSGNGGFAAEYAWAFREGVPVWLDWEGAVTPLETQLLPRGCTRSSHGEPWHLRQLAFRLELYGSGRQRCGTMVIQFALRDHDLQLVGAQVVTGQ